MNVRRMLRAALVAAVALAVTACAGLPTTGPVHEGLGVGDVETGLDVTFLPDGPAPDATPEEIVRGFIEAGTSPADDWAIATQFLTPGFATSWRPAVAITVDRTYASRVIESEVDDSDRTAVVRVTLTPAASVDSAGVYVESPGGQAEQPPYELVRDAEGQWRIASAPDGIVLDQESFAQVFRRHALQYFDLGWEHLVPDPRWFPRERIATMITQAVISGSPTEWLTDAVRSAFPADVRLARESVPVSADTHVADVTLTASALALDATTLARMRTQLERSLSGAGVSAVRFLVDGRELSAGLVDTVPNRIDPNVHVLTENSFGLIVGDEITPLPGVSEPILGLESVVTAIDLTGAATGAAVQLGSGEVYRVADDQAIEVDVRENLVAPSLDGYDYIFSVPGDLPQGLIAWDPRGEAHEVAEAWPEATMVSHIRVAPDGVRIAAIVTLGGQEWLTLAGIVREPDGTPVRLGPMQMHSLLPGEGLGLAWLGDDALGVLTVDGETRQLLEVPIGGPRDVSVVPTETIAIGGANNVAGARLLSSAGVVSIKRGTSWQESASGVLVLATQAGR